MSANLKKNNVATNGVTIESSLPPAALAGPLSCLQLPKGVRDRTPRYDTAGGRAGEGATVVCFFKVERCQELRGEREAPCESERGVGQFKGLSLSRFSRTRDAMTATQSARNRTAKRILC